MQGTEALTQIAYADLEPSNNWQGLGQSQSDRRGFVDLGTFGAVKRGIATGANEFFVLRPSEAAARGLIEANLVACVASASSAPDIVFNEDSWRALVEADKPAYLFDGFTVPCDAAADYVRHGEAQLLHERYLTKQRRPWYRLERRTRAALLLAVFGRQGFRVALNHSQALNLTAFHGFYPRMEHERWTPLIWLYFQTQAANSSFARQHRAYGDGLKKLEPGDWSKLHIPDWRLWDEDMLQEAMKTAQAAADP